MVNNCCLGLVLVVTGVQLQVGQINDSVIFFFFKNEIHATIFFRQHNIYI